MKILYGIVLLLGLLVFPVYPQEDPEVYDLLSHNGGFESDSEKEYLRVSGLETELITSSKPFGRKYHLVVDFKWGERTFGKRADKARMCGIVLPGGIEVELIETLSGNLLLRGERILNRAWNPEWKDEKGWQSMDDPAERKFGHWNRLEIISRDNSISVTLNGIKVNSVERQTENEGRFLIQSKGAECYIGNFSVYPLDSFSSEKTLSKKVSGNGLPGEYPLSPEESAAAWIVDGDWELQLIAHEPLTCDPVDLAWDRRGRMFVAEMRDYPLPPEEGGNLSRIRLLLDNDGDGIMDEAKTWADQLDHVQGILSMGGGIVATTRTAVLFLEDTNGDDVADRISELFKINAPRNVQLQIASPHWGIDNMVYFNNGLDLREIYPGEETGEKVTLWNSNLRFDPKSGRVDPVSGFGQFGACQDDWGHRFFCSNQNPVMAAVMPIWAVHRNRFDPITEGHEDIAPSGRDSKVFPHNFSYMSSMAHVGTNTSACGLVVYRGNATPGITGNLFVCEPTGQLVTRYDLREKGASFIADRVGENRDFLVSSDEWCRPVNLRNGPDGALYVCDMYRRFIDHARFFPEGFPESHFMRAGFDQGRIYRLVKKDSHPGIQALPDTVDELVARLESPNSWQRIQAQDYLVRDSMVGAEGPLRKMLNSSSNPKARVHALWTLVGLELLTNEDISVALGDFHPGVTENAIMIHDREVHRREIFEIGVKGTNRARFLALLELGDDKSPPVTRLFESLILDSKFREDPWLRAAILSGSEERAGEILSNVTRHSLENAGGTADEVTGDLIREFVTAVSIRGVPGELAEILRSLVRIQNPENRIAFAEGMAVGLRQSSLPTTSLASFIKNPLPMCADHIEPLQGIVAAAEAIALDPSLPVGERIAAIPLAGEQSLDEFLPAAVRLITASNPPGVSRAAMKVLRGCNGSLPEELFYENWEQLSLETRQDAIAIIASGKGGASLLGRIKDGRIDLKMVDPVQRWNFLQAEDPAIAKLAGEVFGVINQDRDEVISRYQTVLHSTEPADPGNGEKILTKAGCLSCHRIGNRGVKVGPDLGNLRSKAPEVLLTEILDPNRTVSRNWMGLTVSTIEGSTYTGIITGDGNTTLTLDLPGGISQTIQRNQIENVKPLGISFMPSGFEHVISGKEMKDLIFFLKQN